MHVKARTDLWQADRLIERVLVRRFLVNESEGLRCIEGVFGFKPC
jgi:hypothetical protein